MPGELEDNSLSSLDEQINAHLEAVKSQVERRTVAGLLRQLTQLPLDQTRAAIETSATIAAVSLRASVEFLRAAPAASQILEPAELRAWGEIGRRLTMQDVETGVSFLAAGVGDFAKVPSTVRPFVFQVCTRQMILSAATAAETFRNAPVLAAHVNDPEILRALYEVVGSIARRSAKHSAEFLNVTPEVLVSLRSNQSLIQAAVGLVTAFAEQAGGIAADAWASLPNATREVSDEQVLLLLKRSNDFLERGGAAALHLLLSGGEVLR